MAGRVAPQWVPSCWAAACIPLATPFNERPFRRRAPETSFARGRYSTDGPKYHDPVADGDLVESYRPLSAHGVVSLLSFQATSRGAACWLHARDTNGRQSS